MKTATLAFVPTLLLGLAAADSWGQWDETVTAKVTNTHITCPCDGASTVVVGKPTITPAPETYIEWGYFEETMEVCEGDDGSEDWSDWGNCYESTLTTSYPFTMTMMTPSYTSIPTTKTLTSYVTYTTAECDVCQPKTLTKTAYTTLCETPIYGITQTGPVTHTHTAYITYTTIACHQCQAQTLTSTAYTTMVGSPIYASPTPVTQTHTAYATVTTTVCNMNGACYGTTLTTTAYTTVCQTPSMILPTLTATTSTTSATTTSTSSFTTYTSSGTVIVSPVLPTTTSSSTSSTTTTTTTTTTSATTTPSTTTTTTSFTTLTSSGTVIVSPVLPTTSSTTTTTTTTAAVTTTTTTAVVTTTTTTTAAVTTTTTTTTTAAAQATQTIDVTSYTYINAMLLAHNVHRSNHSEVALTWNANLAAIAAQTAATCVYAHDTTTGGGGYGQNIGAGAAGNAAAGLISNLMYNGEINNYPLPYGNNNPDLSNFGAWGHYSQIVWASTTSVGCATQYCPQGLSGAGAGVPPYFTVCNYSPAGNYVGQFANVQAPLGGPSVVIISS